MPSEVRRTSLRQSSSLAWGFYAMSCNGALSHDLSVSLESHKLIRWVCLSFQAVIRPQHLTFRDLALIGNVRIVALFTYFQLKSVSELLPTSLRVCVTVSPTDSINVLVFPNRQWRLNKPWLVYRTMLTTTRYIYSKSPVYDGVYKKNTNSSKW